MLIAKLFGFQPCLGQGQMERVNGRTSDRAEIRTTNFQMQYLYAQILPSELIFM